MCTGAWTITQRPGDLPAAGTPRWGATITCVSTQSHSPRPQGPAAPLHCSWGNSAHVKHQNAATHPPTQLHAGFGTHTGKPHSPELAPPYLPRASLYITPDTKTKQGKSARTGSPHPQLASPCAFTHHHVIETLNFLGPKSRAISCSKVNAASHTAMSTSLLPTASKYQKVAHSFSTQQIQNYNKGIIINICLAPDL